MTEEDEEILREFLVESVELVDQLDREFVELEQDPGSPSRLASIFRAVHTIKGTSGLLGFTTLEGVTHAGENLLARLRDGKLELTGGMTSALLAMVDAIRAILARIEAHETEGDETYAEIVTTLERFLTPPIADAEPSPPPPDTFGDAPPPPPTPEPPSDGDTDLSEPLPSMTAESLSPTKRADERGASSVATEASVRIGVGLLDKLMNLVGELVLARNQVVQHASAADDGLLLAASQRINLITTELQEGIMKTRMQPIDSVWSKFPRTVRDLAVACGKKVNLELHGRETELDRTIIEAIRDPLIHIIRNAIDHGIEAPEDRMRAGKPSEGTLAFRAFHEAGLVNIEVTDDGKGIDPDAVKSRAVERGLLTREAAAQLSDREAAALIFQPGFSTAAQVTNLSGRGVGMDVVKTSIEDIGGTVDIQSHKGEGTSIRLKIPLTLAIIPALVVTCDEARYAIPQVSVLELVHVEPDDEDAVVEYVRSTPVYRLRGRLLPLIWLSDVLEERRDEGERGESSAFDVVVLQADGWSFGLVVDTVEDTQEIVVKPLGPELKDISAFAGATIMGDGRVALILDVFGIGNKIGMSSHALEAAAADESSVATASMLHDLLVLDSINRERLALPLAQVSRLEEVPSERVEHVGNRCVLQYRGGILPLIFIEDLCGQPRPHTLPEALQVIVVSRGSTTFGLVVGHIADIVQLDAQVHTQVRRQGVSGCVVIDGRTTELIDLEHAIGFAAPLSKAGMTEVH